MFFKKNSKENAKCKNCNSSIARRYQFCPHCGVSMVSPEQEMKEFGLLGREDTPMIPMQENGMLDKIMGSLVNSLMKNLDKQMRELDSPEAIPRATSITIKVGQDRKKMSSMPKKVMSEERIKHISSLPRIAAKTNVRRLADKIVYELETPGVNSSENIFVSKTESGYEIKAIGNDKMYVNSLPVNLPIKNLTIENNKLLVEFNSKQ
ncbi:MAG: zinc ribbon domain-containing protein [archaeon]